MIIKFSAHFDGDVEYSMPMIKHAFRKAGADIDAPTKQDLQLVSGFLVDALSDFNPEGAKQLRMDYNRLIKKL
jgi:hypothetical protein